MAKAKPRDLATRIALIQRGLECAPQNDTLLRHLIALTHLEGPEADSARETLRKMLAEGRATAVLHLALGLDAWQHGQPAEARKHLALAYENAPQLPYVANNMAMILTVGDKPDLPRALTIIESVLERFPNNPNFRETRGEILARSGRPRDAIADLEFALPLLPSKRATHKALAEAYRGLGLRDLAAEHERLADSSS
jgi:predicted Zn-dependent protease